MRKVILIVFFMGLMGVVVTMSFDSRDRSRKIKIKSTQAQLRMLEVLLRDYYLQYNYLPKRLAVFDQSYTTDNWGGEFIYCWKGNKVVLISKGEDRVLYTADDLSYKFMIQ